MVKKNQGQLYDDIALAFAEPDGADCYGKAQSRNRHGPPVADWEIRQLQAIDALNDYLEWPAVGQVCRITRHTQGPAETTSEARYGITSLSDAVEPRTLLRYAQDHWEIENRRHYVRDVTLGEDASQVRKGSAPQVMAVRLWRTQHGGERAAELVRKEHRGGLAADWLDARSSPTHPRSG